MKYAVSQPYVDEEPLKKQYEKTIINMLNAKIEELQGKNYSVPRIIFALDGMKRLYDTVKVITFMVNSKDFDRFPVISVYEEYTRICSYNNFQAVGKVEFSKVVNQYFGYKSTQMKIDGRNTRVYFKM